MSLKQLRWPLPPGVFHAKLIAMEDEHTLLFEAIEGDARGRQARYRSNRPLSESEKNAKLFVEFRGFALEVDEVPDWAALLKKGMPEIIASIWVTTEAEIKHVHRAQYANTNKKNCEHAGMSFKSETTGIKR